MRFTYIFLVLFASATCVWAQSEIVEEIDIENAINQLLPIQEAELDYNDVYDRLFTLYSTPLDLNSATRNDLQSIFLLSDTQVSGILNYREQYGDFRTIYELLTIPGFSKKRLEALSKFLTVSQGGRMQFSKSLKKPAIHELFLRYQQVLEEKKGYTAPDTLSDGSPSSRYAGDPSRLYARYLYSSAGYYSFGFTVEKDPGEKIIWDPETKRYGLDYYSFHGMLENVWKFQRIIIGDFCADFGQGLVFGSGISFGKGTEPVTTVRRNNYGLRPYRSVFEGKEYSGLAMSASTGNIQLNLFASNVSRDARIIGQDELKPDADYFITNISSVGLHRTPSEIRIKHKLKDRALGGNVNFKTNNDRLEIGLNGMINRYSVSVQPKNELYRRFHFKGKGNFNASAYLNYFFRKGHAFSELAISQFGGIASSSGIILNLSSQIQTAIHYRNYGVDYHNGSGNAFGESGYFYNERGIFWGIKIRPVQKLLLSGYFDYFSFPWLRYRISAPSNGKDYMMAIEYQLNEKSRFRLQYRYKVKSENLSHEEVPLPQVVDKTRSRLRFDFRYQPDEHFSFTSWIQSADVKYPGSQSKGYLVAQDAHFSSRKFSFSGRFSLFDSDDFDSRMYIYERDLLYVYSISSNYNKGIRYYLLMSYKLGRGLTMWLKYAKTNFFDLDKISSGLEEIEGDTKTSLSFQLRCKF